MLSTRTKSRYANQILKLGKGPLLVSLGPRAFNRDEKVLSAIQKYLLEKSLFHLVLQMARMSSCRRLLVLVRLQLDMMFLLNLGQVKKIQLCLIWLP